ncbi:hypothetical protein QJQ45_015349 [Haematococcus lacustris]|nr:hypothetical protein QJQ45_015349 [Haematococcus lacustris]
MQALKSACHQQARYSSARQHRHQGQRTIRCMAAASVLMPCRITGVGSAAPATVLTNTDLQRFVDTNNEWIESRTGIQRRHVLGAGESLGQLACQASAAALEMSGVQASDLDLILFATSSPDDLFGGACQVQAALGATRACAFDLTAACSGFVLGLVTASQYIRTGAARNVLLIGGDALSRFVDWNDRSTCILFGDGCGAVVLSAGPPGSPCALLGSAMHSAGAGQKSLNAMFSQGGNKAEGYPSQLGAFSNISMQGQDVFKFAVRSVPTVIEEALAAAGLQKEDINWLVMHQANKRILDSVAERLGLPPDRVVSNLAEYGNTSAGSIPLALDEAVRDKRIKQGDVVAMAGFGAGLTWAASIVRWG